MPNDQLINYFGQKIFNDLSEFFKEESLEILVDNNISLHNTNIIVLYLKDTRRKVASNVTLKNNSIFFTFLLPRFQKTLIKSLNRIEMIF
jgi:hypothetical protein